MSMFDSISRFFSRKDSLSRTLLSQVAPKPYIGTPRNYENFAKEGYQNSVIAFRSISMVASAVGGIPWVLYKNPTSKGGKRQEVDSHPILTLLKRPNKLQAQSAFMQAVVSFRMISGNSYIESAGPARGKITELWPMRPDRMTIVAGDNGYPAAYLYKVNGREIRFEVDFVSMKSPVLHLKYFNPVNDWYGMSPMEAAALNIDQHTEANKWNTALLQNSARPSGAIVATVSDNTPGTLTDEQFKKLKAELEDHHTGAQNSGRPLLLEGGLDWKQIALSPQDMDWLEGKNTSARDIALAFGVPPMLLGIPGDNTYSNYQEARAALYEETVIPEYDSIRDEFNNWLIPAFGDSTLELDTDKDSIHALAPRRQAVWDKIAAANWLTVNEKREATGYDEIQNGDVVLVASTQIPLQDAVEGGAEADPNASGAAGSADAETPDQSQDPEADQGDTESTDTGKAKTPAAPEEKLFNLPSQKEKVKEAQRQVRLRKSFERILTRQAQSVLEIEGHKVKAAVDGFDPMHALAAARQEIQANKNQWKMMLSANLAKTAKSFSSRALDLLKASGSTLERKASDEELDALIKKWADDHAEERVDLISQTTIDRIKRAIQDAQDMAQSDGVELTPEDLQEAIGAAYDAMSESRAASIGRTETGAAAMLGMEEAAKSTGIPRLEKEWVPTDDNRTREDHMQMAGVSVGIDDTFDVGGFQMSRPMDPAGPPEEVINCRCGLVFSQGDADTGE